MTSASWSRAPRMLAAVLCALGIAAAMTGAVTAPAAGVTAVTYTITPTSGPPGTVISYTGTGCPHTDAGGPGRDGAFVLVTLPGGNFSGQTQSVFQRASDGTFSNTLTVPAGLAPGVYDTGVSCFGGGSAGWPDQPGPTFTVTQGAPALKFASTSYSVNENATATVTVSRLGDPSVPVTVDYAATAGTAIANADFTPTSGTLSFAAGDTTKTFPVAVLNDTLAEGRETVRLALSNPTGGASLLSENTATLNIAVSDQQPDAQVSTAATTGFVGNNVYNTTGASQTRTLSARRTQIRNFYVRVQNDGNVTNTVALHGTAAASGSSVLYYSGTTTTNVTTVMRSSTGLRVSLAPGRSKLIRVRIKVLSTAVIGSLKPATVSGVWSGDGTRTDVAKAVVKVIS